MQSIEHIQSVDICRPLGALEHIFWLHDRAHPVHFALTARIKGRFTVHQLQQALNLVQQRHPLLRVGILLDEAERPWFVEDSTSIPLRVVQRQSEQCWQREVEQEIATPFDWSKAPLVRVVLVRSDTELSELIVVYHHSIADGISGTYLIRDILQAITRRVRFANATPAVFGQSLSVPPSLEDLIVREAPETISSSKPIPKFRSDSFVAVQGARQNNHLFVTSALLSAQTTRLLVAQCRQEQTSVHAAICAAFLLAIRHQNRSEQPQSINCGTPINLRPYLTFANHEDICFYAAGERTSHLLSSNTNLWDVARSVKSQLNQSMNPDKLFEKNFQGQKWLSTNPSPDNALQTFKDQVGYDIAVSNLGRLTIEQQFGLELEAIYGPVVTTGMENDRLVGVATLGDRLSLTLTSSEKVMSRSEVKTLHEEAIHLLKQAIAVNEILN